MPILNSGQSYLPSTGQGPVPQWLGVYPAVGSSNADPAGKGALQLQVPLVTGATTMNWVDWTGYNSGKIPSVAFYSAYQIVLVWPARLWVVINAGTQNQQYVVAGRALNTPDVRRLEVEVL